MGSAGGSVVYAAGGGLVYAPRPPPDTADGADPLFRPLHLSAATGNYAYRFKFLKYTISINVYLLQKIRFILSPTFASDVVITCLISCQQIIKIRSRKVEKFLLPSYYRWFECISIIQAYTYVFLHSHAVYLFYIYYLTHITMY